MYVLPGNETQGLDVTRTTLYQSSHRNSGKLLTFALIAQHMEFEPNLSGPGFKLKRKGEGL